MIEAIIPYIIIGAISAFLYGLLGMGGGVFIIPVLLFFYKYQGFSDAILMKLAAGTSLASMIFIAMFSLRAHLRFGATVLPIFKQMLLGIIVGTIFGTTLAHFLHNNLLRILFGSFLVIISLRIFFDIKTKPTRELPGKIGMHFTSFGLSGFGSMLGLSGGTLNIPFLLWCNVEMRQAIAVSIACSVTISSIGALNLMHMGYGLPNLPPWSTGYIYWPSVIGIVVASPIFTYLGAKLSHSLNLNLLKKFFAVFLLILAVRMLIF